MLLHFRIQLADVKKPPVWHKITVPDSFTFHRFHLVIQAAFSWENYHPCPPEDCGGRCGYQALKETISDPKHPDYNDMREWLGLEKDQPWDAAAFDLPKTKKAIQKI